MIGDTHTDLVTVGVHFEIPPEASDRFQDAWRRVFLPAIRVREGFADCRLWQQWPRDGDPPSTGRRYRLDITFETEELRMRWATSPEHEVAFGTLRAISAPVSSLRFTSVTPGD